MKKSIHSPQHQILLNLLRRLRKQAGFSQAGLAAVLGVPQSFVSKYESGERRLDLVELSSISNALHISLVEIVRQFVEDTNEAR